MTAFLSVVLGRDDVLAELRGDRRRMIYECEDGSFAVDHQGGVVARDVIDALERSGEISRRWPDRPDLNAWHLAR